MCDKCNDEGYWFDGEKMVICSCQQQKMVESKKAANGITPKMARNRLESFDLSFYTRERRKAAQTSLYAAREFVKECVSGGNPEGMVILGSVGSGKTYLASAIISELIENGIEAKLVVLHDLIEELKEAMKDDSPQRIVNQIKTYPVLAIDDLGADSNTEFAVSTVFSLINYRLNYELPTIVTTNLSTKDLEEKFGSRIYSRLLEMCKFYLLDGDMDIRFAKKRKERKR